MKTQNSESNDPLFKFWGNEKVQIAAIFLLALIVRIVHLLAMKANSPFYDLPAVDSDLFDHVGQQIADGDWLGKGVFYYNPFYPYFIGVCYWIFGHSFTALKFVQILIGSGSCVLMYLVTKRLSGRPVAILASLTVAWYDIFIFYDELLLAEFLSVFTLLLTAWVLFRAEERQSLKRFSIAGLCLGLSYLVRPTLLPVAAVIWTVYVMRQKANAFILLRLAILFVTCACVIIPVTIRNYYVGHDLVLVSSHVGLNFYLGNNPEANGGFRLPRFIPRTMADSPADQQEFFTSYAEKEMKMELKPSQVSNFWFKKGVEFITGQPGKWLKLASRKLMLMLNKYEFSDNQAYYFSKEYSWILRLPLINFGLVCPLALLGMLLTIKKWREFLLLNLFILFYGSSLLFFFINSRYRMPLVPFFIIFAAYAVYWMYTNWTARQFKLLGLAIIPLALFTIVAHNTTFGGSKNPSFVTFYNVGNKFLDKGLLNRAAKAYKMSISRNPNYISSHNNLAVTYERNPKWRDKAIKQWKKVLEMGKKIGSDKHVNRAQQHIKLLERSSSRKTKRRTSEPTSR